MASIHVKDYDLMFGKMQEERESQPFLAFNEGQVAFLKVYLMPYIQFEKLICYLTGSLPFLLPEKIQKSKQI